MDTSIEKIHYKLYIPSIQNLEFYFHILTSWVLITVANKSMRNFSAYGLINMLDFVLITKRVD